MSKTYFEVLKDPATGDIVGRFNIAFADMVEMKLDNLDRIMLGSPHESMADMALDLELILRRIEQTAQTPKDTK